MSVQGEIQPASKNQAKKDAYILLRLGMVSSSSSMFI